MNNKKSLFAEEYYRPHVQEERSIFAKRIFLTKKRICPQYDNLVPYASWQCHSFLISEEF